MRKLGTLMTAFLAGSLMMGLWGCEKNQDVETAQAPTEEPNAEQPLVRQFDRQCENADLTDMVLSDVHFLPHRAALNGTGTAKLHRLAWLVDRYGGAITLDLQEITGPLTEERVKVVKAYLKARGLPEDKIQVAVGLPETKGMHSDEAIVIYGDTRHKPKEGADGGKKWVVSEFGK